MSSFQIIVLVLISAGWIAFTWWTVRRLWQTPKDPKDALTAKVVKLGSVAITVMSALGLPIRIPMPPFEYWQLVGIWAISFFPVILWAVHFGMLVTRAFADSHYSE